MSLSNLIQKRPPVGFATVTVATLATHGVEKGANEVGNGATVAKVATVTVATVTVATATGAKTASASWLLHFPDREPLTVTFSPPSTHAEVLDAYPAALVAAEPIESGRRHHDTPLAGDQEAAVLAWLSEIGETDETTIADVLTLCRQDEEARRYFLGRAVEISANDDRRCCSQCGNLRSGVCVVARPGGRVSAIVGYRPASPDVLQRCAGYSSTASRN